MALPPPDPTPKKKKPSPRRRLYTKVVKKNTTPPPKVRGDWDTKTPRETMPGPNRPDPKYKKVPGVLGDKAAKNGAYLVPGLGQWARQRNDRRARRANTHPFNPGRSDTNSA